MQNVINLIYSYISSQFSWYFFIFYFPRCSKGAPQGNLSGEIHKIQAPLSLEWYIGFWVVIFNCIPSLFFLCLSNVWSLSPGWARAEGKGDGGASRGDLLGTIASRSTLPLAHHLEYWQEVSVYCNGIIFLNFVLFLSKMFSSSHHSLIFSYFCSLLVRLFLSYLLTFSHFVVLFFSNIFLSQVAPHNFPGILFIMFPGVARRTPTSLRWDL
jgi:hypothetical protein